MQLELFAAVVGEEVQRDFRNWFDVIPQTSDPLIREVGGRKPLTFSELHAFAQDINFGTSCHIHNGRTLDRQWLHKGHTRDTEATR